MNQKHEVGLAEDVDSRAQLATRYTEYEKSLTFFEAAKIYWRSSLYVLYGLLLAFNYGMDGVVAGYQVSGPKSREDYDEPLDAGHGVIAYNISAHLLAIFSAVAQAYAVIGAATAEYIADKVGRRNAAVISCVVSIGGVAAQYWFNGSLGILCVGKAINGFSLGMWLVLGPLYAGEMAALRLPLYIDNILLTWHDHVKHGRAREADKIGQYVSDIARTRGLTRLQLGPMWKTRWDRANLVGGLHAAQSCQHHRLRLTSNIEVYRSLMMTVSDELVDIDPLETQQSTLKHAMRNPGTPLESS